MYGDLVEDLREGLAVSAEYDGRLLRALKKGAKSLLRAYNFREAVRKATLPIAALASTVELPTDAGKVKFTRLVTVEGETTLFKVLKRRDEGQLPVYEGPSFYYVTGQTVYLDTALPVDAVGYNVEIWYQSVDPVVNEAWLSETYGDVLEHMVGVEQAMKLRKPEAMQMYQALWSQDIEIMGRYIPELEFSNQDLSMGDVRSVALERYPAA